MDSGCGSSKFWAQKEWVKWHLISWKRQLICIEIQKSNNVNKGTATSSAVYHLQFCSWDWFLFLPKHPNVIDHAHLLGPAFGHDSMSARLLKETSINIAPALALILNCNIFIGRSVCNSYTMAVRDLLIYHIMGIIHGRKHSRISRFLMHFLVEFL